MYSVPIDGGVSVGSIGRHLRVEFHGVHVLTYSKKGEPVGVNEVGGALVKNADAAPDLPVTANPTFSDRVKELHGAANLV